MSSRPVPCPCGHVANFCTPYAPNGLAPAHTSFLQHVIANQCLTPAHTSFLLHVIASQCSGAPQRGTLCGERRPKGALPGSGLWPELGMADFGATRCGNPRPLGETWYIAPVPGCAHTCQVCHCTPVRTLVWQSVSPQRNLASWQYLGRIRNSYEFAQSTAIICYAALQRGTDYLSHLPGSGCPGAQPVSPGWQRLW